MLDLKYFSLVHWLLDSILSPTPPPAGPGVKSVIVRTTCGSLDGPFFDHSFASILESMLDSLWVRFGLLSDTFWLLPWGPKSGQVGPKLRLEASFFENDDFHADQGIQTFLTVCKFH